MESISCFSYVFREDHLGLDNLLGRLFLGKQSCHFWYPLICISPSKGERGLLRFPIYTEMPAGVVIVQVFLGSHIVDSSWMQFPVIYLYS